MSALQIHQFPARTDNYGVLIHDEASNLTASIDAPDDSAVLSALQEKNWTLTHILTTHHHADHTAGNLRLKEITNCTIIGPGGEADKIPGIDSKVAQGSTIEFGSFRIEVLDTPGHTAGHISYVIPKASVAFVGDTLFAMGCGRLFEGTPKLMWSSLCKLRELPEETKIYCGHEYTLANARFAITIEPQNEQLKQRLECVEAMRNQGQPTLPTTLREELATNPFLRAGEQTVKDRLGMQNEADWKVFAEIRSRKDNA